MFDLSVAPLTLSSYSKTWNRMRSHFNVTGLEIFRPTIKMINDYIIHLTEQGATTNTLANLRACLSHYGAKLNFDPAVNSLTTAKLIKGASSVNAPSNHELTPLTKSKIQDVMKLARENKNFSTWRTCASIVVALSLIHI